MTSLIDDIKRDREAGTPFATARATANAWGGPFTDAQIEADANRRLRIPAMEARILRDAEIKAAAEKLAEVLGNPVRSDDGFYDYLQHDIDAALAAYRAATGESE